MSNTVRTRFAPSPTGYLHVGGIRTALFAWLLARQNGGQFILRIEDTDQAREVAGSADHIIESLGWMLASAWDGPVYDEGPSLTGEKNEYYQSQRLDIYRRWAQKLIDEGRAYADPYTSEEVQAFRLEAQQKKQPFLYRNHRPEPEETKPWDGTTALRFKSDPKPYAWHDAVMGDLKTGPEVIDDFILIKSDGFPTYNFAHIVDDAEMAITHVIRGQEFLASMPNYLNLYEALGVARPILATVPHIMAPGGKKKLSKRDGAKDILDYREEGYLPEAFVNFLGTLGWNDGTEKEVFTIEELVAAFSLDRVQKSGAGFDERRLLWLQGEHVRNIPLDAFMRMMGKPPYASFWPDEAFQEPYTEDYRREVLGLVQERLKYFGELQELTMFFFKDLPVNPALISEHKQLKKLESNELKNLLQQARDSLAGSDFSAQDLTARLNALLEATGQKPAVLFSLIRIATTQSPASPSLAETMQVLGKERSLQRIDQQLAAL